MDMGILNKELMKYTPEFGINLEIDSHKFFPATIEYACAWHDYNSSPTRGFVVKELERLSEAEDRELSHRIENLSEEATQALFGAYITARWAFDGEITAVMIGGSDQIAAEMRALTARAHRNRQSIPVKPVKSPLPQLGSSYSHGKAITEIHSAAKRHPDLLRAWAEYMKHVAIEIFQITPKKSGENVSVIAGRKQNPDWLLVSSVLDIIWPIENGGMHSRKMNSARHIIMEIKNAAIRGLSVKFKRTDGYIFNENILSHLLTMRKQIHQLSESLYYIDEKISLENSDFESTEIFDYHSVDDIYRTEREPLLTWKKELQRRVKFSDRYNRNIDKRFSRPSRQLPKYPRFKKTDIHTQTAILVEAARSLREPDPVRKPDRGGDDFE